jgi:hypothetical protein
MVVQNLVQFLSCPHLADDLLLSPFYSNRHHDARRPQCNANVVALPHFFPASRTDGPLITRTDAKRKCNSKHSASSRIIRLSFICVIRGFSIRSGCPQIKRIDAGWELIRILDMDLEPPNPTSFFFVLSRIPRPYIVREMSPGQERPSRARFAHSRRSIAQCS